jgi:small subunit ribosomal protein S16
MQIIRFQRIGRTNDPAFRIVLLEKERAAKTGRITEQLGTYNPKSKAFKVDDARVKEWVGKGAQVSGSVKNLFITKGILEGKKVNVLPKKTVPKAAEPAAEAAPAPAAETAPAPEAPAAEAAAPEPAAEEPKAEEAPAA